MPERASAAPTRLRCADPFHVVKWATDALDEVRRSAWNDARKAARQNDARRTRGRPARDAPARPDSARAAGVKNSRYALWNYADERVMPSWRRGLLWCGGCSRIYSA